MTIDDYFRQIEAAIATSPIVHTSSVTYDKRSDYVGFLRGALFFLDGSRLYIREFVNVEYGIDRYMYSFHYQRPDGTLIFRYDNTPHHPQLQTFPHHKHVGVDENVFPVQAPDLAAVLDEIRRYLFSHEMK